MVLSAQAKLYQKNRIFNNEHKRRIAVDMLERYTGSDLKSFRKQIILTNFHYYIERFRNFPNTTYHKGSAWDCCHNDDMEVSIVNFSIGSPNAALCIELLSVVEPKCVLFLGMCGGLHRSLKKGDFILPTAAIRDEGASKHFMPAQVPALPTFKVQKFVSQMIVEKGLDYRTGVVHTTDYRFWEFNEEFKSTLYNERALAVDMETATLFIGGFASKVPIGALLLVSDLPLTRGGIKTKKSATKVFKEYTDLHLDVGIKAMKDIKTRGEHIRHYKW
jgi:AMP nucleosidase